MVGVMKLSFINMQTFLSHINLFDVFLSLLGLFIFTSIMQKLTHKGPMSWPIFGIIPTIFFNINNIYNWLTNTLLKTGGSFHFKGVWMTKAYGVFTIDPSNIEYILKTRFNNFPKGDNYKQRFHDLLGDGIFNVDDEPWKVQRRAVSLEMHSSCFLEYSLQTMQSLVHDKLLKVVEKFVKSGDTVDLQDLLLRFTFDNICTVAFGVEPGCSAIDLPEVPFAKAFEEATELTLLRFIEPPFVWKLMKFFDICKEKRLRKAVQIVHDFAKKTVSNRRIEYNKFGHLNHRSDMLSKLMDTEKYNFSDNLLKDFCINFILAGRDTSSVALVWFFWLIHEHPHVERLILNELSNIISQRNAEIDNIVFTIDELKTMVYLQAALSEALRLYPSVPLDFKQVLEDDELPDGSIVKKGAWVIYCIYSIARVEKIWGSDCREFKPERWIENGQLVKKNQFKYVVFNAGPRLCVGKKFANMQMKMVAASILLRYSVQVVKGQNVVPKINTTLYMKNGLLVTFKPRLNQQM